MAENMSVGDAHAFIDTRGSVVAFEKVALQLIRAGDAEIARTEMTKIMKDKLKPFVAKIRSDLPKSKRYSGGQYRSGGLTKIIGIKAIKGTKAQYRAASVARRYRRSQATGTGTFKLTSIKADYVVPAAFRIGAVKKVASLSKKEMKGRYVAHNMFHGSRRENRYTGTVDYYQRNYYVPRNLKGSLTVALSEFQREYLDWTMKRLMAVT